MIGEDVNLLKDELQTFAGPFQGGPMKSKPLPPGVDLIRDLCQGRWYSIDDGDGDGGLTVVVA